MAPQTGTALVLLAVFVLPGFITLLIRERTHTIRGEESAFERLLNALYYSALIYALAIGLGVIFGLAKDDLVSFYRGEKTLDEDLLAAALVALVLPLVIAETGRLWRRSGSLRPKVLARLGISPAHGVASAWNDLFGREGTMLLRATLDDGRVVGGYYGPESFASYSEHSRDLYISERWQLDEDGWFAAPAPESLGLWLSRDSIVSIEAYQEASSEDTSRKALVRVNIDS